MDGLLIIDKVSGPTSHDVVAGLRRTLGVRKVGHTGTLDPAATGVLPLVLGKATKLARYLAGADKSYEAVIRLGVSTDTLDGQGEVTREASVSVTEDSIREAVAFFVGSIEQVPPMYSAKKIDGKRLYQLARQGIEVEREAKTVNIHRIEVLGYSSPDLTVEISCSAGTYVRVLADDLGEKLGCGGHLASLRRTRVGGFSLEGAVTLEALAKEPEKASDYLLPLKDTLAALPSISVPTHMAYRLRHGYQLNTNDLRQLDVPSFQEGDALALRMDDGELVAVARSLVASGDLQQLRRDKRVLKTERVLSR